MYISKDINHADHKNMTTNTGLYERHCKHQQMSIVAVATVHTAVYHQAGLSSHERSHNHHADTLENDAR